MYRQEWFNPLYQMLRISASSLLFTALHSAKSASVTSYLQNNTLHINIVNKQKTDFDHSVNHHNFVMKDVF